MVRRVFLAAVLSSVLVTIPVSTALAQLAGDAPSPPEYQVKDDGTLIVGGDIVSSCFQVGLDDQYLRADGPEARACEAAGFEIAGNGSSGGASTGGDPPDYVLEEDGTVLIDGDLATDCRSFAGGPVPPADGDPDLDQARSVVEQCEKAGLLPSESAAPSAAASSEVPADGEGEGLPETGGPALPALLVVAVAVVVAGGLRARKVAG